MLLSEYIGQLQDIFKTHGDLEVCESSNDGVRSYNPNPNPFVFEFKNLEGVWGALDYGFSSKKVCSIN